MFLIIKVVHLDIFVNGTLNSARVLLSTVAVEWVTKLALVE